MNGYSLDLCLSPITSALQSRRRNSTVSNQSSARRSNKIIAFYNGRFVEYDLVEIQIRAIIDMASKKHEVTALELTPARFGSPLGFTVKRSVKSFLEKRKKRSKSVTPQIYTYTTSLSPSSSSHNF